jgi:hypothetical protein
MLVIIAVIFLILWLLGVVAIHISSPLIHLLLIIAVVIFLYDLFIRRRSRG